MIKIKKVLWNEIIQYLQDNWPNEACGILGGKRDSVSKVYPIANVDANPRVRYLIDPKGQFQAVKDMRKEEIEMLGIFHSHPETPAIPSVTDIGLAYYPDAYYIIISLKDRKKPDAHAFRIINGKVKEYPIVVE